MKPVDSEGPAGSVASRILSFSEYFLPAVCLTDTIKDWKDILFSRKVKPNSLLQSRCLVAAAFEDRGLSKL